MSAFYVLDVPEFAPFVSAVRADERCSVGKTLGGYVRVQFDGEIVIERRATGLSEAVWFGCLTAGLDGKIVSFDEDRIALAPTNEPIVHG